MDKDQQHYNGEQRNTQLYSDSPLSPPNVDQSQNKQQSQYTFSPEEIRVMRECNRESLLFRCIPFATVLSGGAFYAMAKGYWSRSPRFGVAPKVMGCAFVGYLIGKFSYRNTCADKILTIPDSKLANVIRKARGMPAAPGTKEVVDTSNQGMADVFNSIPQTPIFDDHKPDERDRNEGLVEYQKVTDSMSEYAIEDEIPKGAAVASYEDRRRSNRDDYTSKFADRRKKQTTIESQYDPTPPPGSSSNSSLYGLSTTPLAGGRRNKYGDLENEE